nr:unnamed protein product [Callosobruchus analis]
MDNTLTDSDQTFLGLDLSSQTEVHINFDSELPEFGTRGGAIINVADKRRVTVPSIMWVKALDMLMQKLMLEGADFSKIAAVSGSAQQHGTVYWKKGAESTLKNLSPNKLLHHQLNHSFSVSSSPIWMDSSTTTQCKQLEEAVGGPERISLISSFLCSLLLGQIAPIDISDGSGMNLLDIRTKRWNQTLLDACGPNLDEKLGQPVPSYSDIGFISGYFKERYNFNPNCRVIAHTGDNPASLIGMRRYEGWIAVSLGTSDTVFLWLKEPKVVLDGNVLCNPLDENAYMAMLGFNKDGATCKFSSPEVEVRALVEGQFIAKRAYAEEFGIQVGQGTKILATGGASQNKTILQVLADVFNSPVYVFKEANSAALGAGYQAKHGLMKSSLSYEDMMSSLPDPELACEPYHDAEEVYTPMVERYRSILKACILNENLKLLKEVHVNFDSELPEFRTTGGAIIDKADNRNVTVPTIMWVKALDMLMDKLMLEGVDFAKIAAVSGSAQQHGTVYWQKGAEETLKTLSSSDFLHQQLNSSFSVTSSPIWMDSSTTKQCKQLEEAVGGPEKLAEITGSRAYERFSGSQIAKIFQTKPDAYKNTERISLISSFLCSIFLGKIAPIDISDGSGMNLLDIRIKKWNQTLLDTCGPNLAEKLGDPVPSYSDVGPISNYFKERYNFNSNCRVIAHTGDNPASLIGMRLNEGWIAVSLGTSDTAFLWLKEPKMVLDGHVLCNPLDENAYMALLW